MIDSFKDIEIIDSDIESAEKHFNLSFNADQKQVIKFLSTVDVQACPGSGKTTTLAAKLFILANKIPPSFNRGVCIITHTNVAVNEIKRKLGDAGTRFLKYPNHFGTIQSFVDKFLTIPGYVNEFKKRPERIDDETYFKQIEGRFKSSYRYNQALLGLSYKNIEHYHLRFSCTDFSLVKSIYGDAIGFKDTTDTVVNATRCKNDVLKDGYICFEDAYSIGFKYLRKYPKIKELFEQRFAYVFIDEMQDMDVFQANILDKVFNIASQNVCIQRIGDINQAIFTSSKSKTEGKYWVPQNHLEIKTSVRLSKEIADRVHNVCISPQVLGGREDTPQIKPVILGFNENNNIASVKIKFAELIALNKLTENEYSIFKAVALKKDHGKALDKKKQLKLSLKDYFEEYNGKLSFKKSEFESLSEYLIAPCITVSDAKDKILLSFSKALKIGEIIHPLTKRYFTPSSLTKYLAEYCPELNNAMRLKMVIWLKDLININARSKEIIQFFENDLWQIWNKPMNINCKTFLTIPPITETSEIAKKLSINNCYEYTNKDLKIPIRFATIHSIKGETHCATLYLETYNYSFDIEKIIPFILGEKKQSQRNANLGRLKTSYVAMTRPTHLLVLAVRENIIAGKIKDLEDAGWQVIILPKEE